jgi:putative endonuclease
LAGKIRKAKPRARRWVVYLLRLRGGALYCGITNDLPRRLAAHNSGRGAKCIVPSKRPAKVAYVEAVRGFSAALRREYAIKKLSKARKEALVKNGRL